MRSNVQQKENIPHLSLWKAYREKNDSSSFEALVKRYMSLVTRMANRVVVSMPQRSITKDDLVGMGYIGLIEAVQHFDYTKGYQFETYGLWRIKGAMLDGIRKIDWVPRSFRDRAKKINQAILHLQQTLLRTPTFEEISEHAELPVEEIEFILSTQSLTSLLSLEESVSSQEEDGRASTLLEQIPDDKSVSQEQHLTKIEFQSILAQCIEKLAEKEKLVISLLYFEELTQTEIAEVLGLSRGRVSQLHSLAIAHLRQAFEARGFAFDLFC